MMILHEKTPQRPSGEKCFSVYGMTNRDLRNRGGTEKLFENPALLKSNNVFSHNECIALGLDEPHVVVSGFCSPLESALGVLR